MCIRDRDAENETVVAGAEFGLYAKEDILAHGEVAVKADTLLGKAVSNEDGKAVFELDLPFGSYYICLLYTSHLSSSS